MASNRGWIRRFHPAADDATHTVVLFPHAGGGASSYRLLSAALVEAGTRALIVQYPGRQDRAAEPHPGSLAGLARGAVTDLRAELDGGPSGPLTLFGHSMGALVAFEAARALEADGVPVAHLVPSAGVAPSRVAELPPHPSSDEDLLARAAMLDGSDPAVLAESAIARLAIPAMRADFAAFDAYTCATGVTVDAPVTALGGLDDPAVPPAHLHGWAGHTTAQAQVRMLPGGHFFVDAQLAAITRVLTASPVLA